VKTVHIWLLLLAAMALTAPLGAEEINAPDAQWQAAAADQPSTANGVTVGGDAKNAAQPVPLLASLQAPNNNKKNGKQPTKPADDQESHERVMGLAPMFTVVNDASTARALTVDEKWRLFYRQTYDPFQFASAGISAGISQAENQLSGYGQGMQGYGKRYGATLADNSLGAFFGNFLLPSMMHDDPRYFRQGSGSFVSRLVHAASGAVVTHRDNGTTRPNYANVLGNFIGCGIGNLYYPQSDRGVGTTFERGAQVTLTGSLGGILQEFWPDIHNKIFRNNKIAQ